MHGWVSRLCAAAVLTHVALARTHAMPGRAAHHPFSKRSVAKRLFHFECCSKKAIGSCNSWGTMQAP